MRQVLSVVTAAVLAASIAPACAAQTAGDANSRVMPLPRSVQAAAGGALLIQPNLTVALAATRSPRLQAATLRALKRMEDSTGTPLPRAIGNATSGTLTLNVQSDGEAVQGLDEDESYTLTSTASGVTVNAATTAGAIHALETLLQLVQPSAGGYAIPAVTIHDSPRFRWRGMLIDCGRHFEPVDVLKRNLDAMAAVKLNVFHWHLTEDQGFRIESKVFPKLTANGSDGLFYTQDDAREIVRYARDRGIRVVPEFEMPGHSTAWLVAYPEMSSGTVPTGIRREFGVSQTAIDPTREETYRFIERFLTEMAGIFPDEYVHIGGDEAPASDWKTNPRILAFKKAHNLADNDALQAYFNTRVLAILTLLHKRMAGWDEVLTPTLPKDVVVQSWRGEASLAKGAAQGYRGILSAGYYLDGMQTAGTHYLVDPVPAGTAMTPEQQGRVLGGEIAMWGEQVNGRTIDSRIWPRAAAIAERLWSPQDVRDVDDMYRRLWPVSIELESLGLQHLSHEDVALRSLADTESIDALRMFARAFEPVSFHDRYQQQHTSALTPLTGFVDAVVPDPPDKHRLEQAVRRLLANPRDQSSAAELTDFFERTAATVPAVQQSMQNNPRLQPMAQRAQQLTALDAIGQRAVRCIAGMEKPTAEWKSASLQQLEEAKQPSAIVRFIMQDALTQLVNACRTTP